jgi:hypothetical protein
MVFCHSGGAMSEQEFGKKLVEEADFIHFADAYEHVTGTRLEIVATTERPDFICERGNGTRCGVELTQVRRNPESRLADQIMNDSAWMSPTDASWQIYNLTTCKDRKRQDPDWKLPKDTILVVQLMDCPLDEIGSESLDTICDDLAGLGFSEIWLADYTTLEPFREVELFCVSPEQLQGHYARAHPDKKPYG